MNPNLDLEAKASQALIMRLTQHELLKDCNTKQTNSDTPRIDGTIVVRCQRGEENPPESGVFNIAVEIEMRVRMNPRLNTLLDFNAKNLAIQEVLMTPWRIFVDQLNACQPDFHCYFFAVTDKDPSPVEDYHACIWSCSMIGMPCSFDTALKLNTP